MGTRPVSFNQLAAAVETIEANLEALKLDVANLIQHISTGIPSKRDLDRIRQEIVLMKESGDYVGNQVGNINDADLRAMLELKPTLDNLIAMVESFDDWKISTGNTMDQIANQLGAVQLQLSALERRIKALE